MYLSLERQRAVRAVTVVKTIIFVVMIARPNRILAIIEHNDRNEAQHTSIDPMLSLPWGEGKKNLTSISHLL
jgi:hypothetical protein